MHTSYFPNMNKSRRKNKVQFLMRNQMSVLFKKTEKYHSRRLREMFRKYYWPVRQDDEWTIGISYDVIQDFKLHLSWEQGRNLFHLNRTQIGLEILSHYKKLGLLLFLKKIITDEQWIVNIIQNNYRLFWFNHLYNEFYSYIIINLIKTLKHTKNNLFYVLV